MTHRRTQPGWFVLATVLALSAGVVLLWRSYATESDYRRIMEERGKTALYSLAAGIRAQTMRGRFSPDRLLAILEESAQTPGAVGVRIARADGESLAVAGAVDEIPAVPPGEAIWGAGWLAMSMQESFGRVDMGPGPPPDRPQGRWLGPGGPGRGPRPWEDNPGWGPRSGQPPEPPSGQPPEPPSGQPPEPPSGPPPEAPSGDASQPQAPPSGEASPFSDMTRWGDDPYVLTIVLDANEVTQAIRRERVKLAITAGALAACAASAALLLGARARQRHLEGELGLAHERLAHQEHLSRLGAGLAHETRNPLGVVRGLAQEITGNPGAPPEVKRTASAILDQSDRIVGQINAFLSLARPKEPELRPIDLARFLTGFLPLLQAEAGDGVTVALDIDGLPERAQVAADEDMLRRLVLNLTSNACRACRVKGAGDGRVVVAARSGGEGRITLCIEDNGCGVKTEDLCRLTEPYFGRFQGGTGLGLAIVEQIARAHGWILRIDSEQGQGATVTLSGLALVQ